MTTNTKRAYKLQEFVAHSSNVNCLEISRDSGCYKVILDCTPELRAYYAKCGFVDKGVQMAVYF
ncbi:Glucosamine 6-phosphate N-acetyltransferase [Zea mays]|uniref:Glucosamine 6-phosphate N-acetyltransferase n=1 Tax=Zea mays TaxID=4577 RepID=A0A1D6FNF4_MAIZE|nr:Glucosamine 6-phosphate N-acetyltransferase [Zea mays]